MLMIMLMVVKEEAGRPPVRAGSLSAQPLAQQADTLAPKRGSWKIVLIKTTKRRNFVSSIKTIFRDLGQKTRPFPGYLTTTPPPPLVIMMII